MVINRLSSLSRSKGSMFMSKAALTSMEPEVPQPTQVTPISVFTALSVSESAFDQVFLLFMPSNPDQE